MNIAAKFSDNGLNGVQPEACSRTDVLGGEEGIKNIRPNLFRNSWSGITNLDHGVVLLAEGSHPKFTLPGHGCGGVLDDVGPDLIQLRSHRVHE